MNRQKKFYKRTGVCLFSVLVVFLFTIFLFSLHPSSEKEKLPAFLSSEPDKNKSENIEKKDLNMDIYKKKRKSMVEKQIVGRGVNNKKVIDAMLAVSRENFVPEKMKPYAYDDRPLPIDSGQTISQPYIVALMTELISPSPGDKILEIGSGSGYQAAVLAEIADTVYTIEIIKKLVDIASANIENAGYENVNIKHGDGYKGWPSKAPFDSIIITAAAKKIPNPLIKQLKESGKIVMPIGRPGGTQELIVGVKKGDKLETTAVTAVRFVPMTGEAQED